MDQIDVATLLTALLILFFFHQVLQFVTPQHEPWSEKKPRRLRPRTPEDCPFCGEEHEKHCHPWVRLRKPPVPYKERKSRRGRPKEKQTEGHCCWNLGCEYYGIRNADIHALVGDGFHGVISRAIMYQVFAPKPYHPFAAIVYHPFAGKVYHPDGEMPAHTISF